MHLRLEIVNKISILIWNVPVNAIKPKDCCSNATLTKVFIPDHEKHN